MSLDAMSESPDFQGWAVEFLNARLRPDMRAFEWGSGWSTIWLGARCASVVSVEHDLEWYDVTARRLVEYDVMNVELVHVPKDEDYAAYADYINNYPDGRFHIVSVDGRNRAGCIRNAMAKLMTPGGMMVVDDYPRAQYQDALGLMHDWSRALFWNGSEILATGVWFRPA